MIKIQEKLIIPVQPRIKEKFNKTCKAIGERPQKLLKQFIVETIRLSEIPTSRKLTKSLTIKQYLSLSENKRKELWNKWEREEEKSVKTVKVKKHAVPAR